MYEATVREISSAAEGGLRSLYAGLSVDGMMSNIRNEYNIRIVNSLESRTSSNIFAHCQKESVLVSFSDKVIPKEPLRRRVHVFQRVKRIQTELVRDDNPGLFWRYCC